MPEISTARPRPPARRDSRRRRLLALADLFSLGSAYGLVWLVAPAAEPLSQKAPLLAALPLWVLLNKLLGLYDRDANVIHKSTLDEVPRIALSVVLGTGCVFLFGPLIPGLTCGREQAILFMVAALAMVPAVRTLARATFGRRATPERCLIIGSGQVARSLATKLAAHPEYRVELVGFVDEAWAEVGDAPTGDEPPLLGDLEDFESRCEQLEVERVIVAFSSISHEQLIGILRTSKQLNLKVTVVPRLFEAIADAVEIEQVEGMTLLGLRGLARTRSSLRLKRLLDLALTSCGLLVLAPLLGIIALAVKLTSRGPVLFVQRRIGRDNAPFDMLKFRTMYTGAEQKKGDLAHLNEATWPMFKITRDPRVTPLGRFLRRFSLDELPQLLNVLRGEMSMVGPRPLIPDEDAQVIGRHRSRLDLTPGLTGPWQVLGGPAIPFAEMIKLDYLYVTEWSLWNDIKLLIRTASVVLGGRGR